MSARTMDCRHPNLDCAQIRSMNRDEGLSWLGVVTGTFPPPVDRPLEPHIVAAVRSFLTQREDFNSGDERDGDATQSPIREPEAAYLVSSR